MLAATKDAQHEVAVAAATLSTCALRNAWHAARCAYVNAAHRCAGCCCIEECAVGRTARCSGDTGHARGTQQLHAGGRGVLSPSSTPLTTEAWRTVVRRSRAAWGSVT